MLRTIEEILGLQPLGLYDALQPPMAAVFSIEPAEWSYSVRVPAILRKTRLPLPKASRQDRKAISQPSHDAGYWAQKTEGYDFSAEDKLDSAQFNLVLWKGLKGEDQPYPSERDGRDLSRNRKNLLRQSTRAGQ
jgi:hypothetical protein